MAFAVHRQLRVVLGFMLMGWLLSACSEPSASNPSTPLAEPATHARDDSSPPPAEPYDAKAQIEQLKELRDKGLITEVEFQQKRKLLLERQ